MAKLGELYKITSGGTPSRTHSEYYEDGTIPWVKTGDLKDKYLFETDEKISQLGLENSSARIYLKNTVLLAMYGATIGATSILKIDAATNQACAAFSPREDTLPEYLYAFLESQKDKFIKDAVGGAQPNLSAGYLKTIEFKISSLEQKTRITRNLSKIDELLLLRKQQIAKLDELVKARFVEMFGDPVKNTMDWEIKPLSELGELNRGVSKARPRNSPELLGGPYPLIQTGEVANAKTYITSFNSTYSEKGLAQSKMWPKGTLCITIAANIAQTSILTFDACFPDSVVGFISRNMTNELFIHYWFSFFQKILDEQAPQVAQKNINLKILSELNVIVPPLSLQNRFAAFVERVDQQKQTVQQSLEKLELMKKALMQEYFG